MTEAEQLRIWLQKHTLLTDGAMGTYYASRCKEATEVCEYANLTNPALIEEIHKEYIAAGANLIKTNTFALGQLGSELTGEQEKEMVQSACQTARAAILGAYAQGQREPVFLAADFGPIPQYADRTEEEVWQQYQRLCDLFLEEGLTIFWFETFAEGALLKRVVEYIRTKCAEAWIAVGFCLNKNGYTVLGKRADRLLAEWEQNLFVDAIGFNCGIGPGHMKQLLLNLTKPLEKYLFAAPNAGYPEQAGNRMAFLNNVGYFAEMMALLAKAGVPILGACCGSTPGYIRSIAKKLTELENAQKMAAVKRVEAEQAGEELLLAEHGKTLAMERKECTSGAGNAAIRGKAVLESAGIEPEERLSFVQKLAAGEKVIAVELDPPFNADISKIMDCGRRLKPCGVDVITFADSPMGRSRIDSVLMSAKMKQELGVEVMPHICCRDKNMIAMRSMLLGAHIHDIRNLLLVTGDPIPAECRTTTTSVFDYNSIRLMQYVRELNEEHFLEEPFVYGGALNYAGVNVDAIIKRMQNKIEAGASYFMTQPIFAKEDRERVAFLKEKTGAKILCGIMPPVSYKNAVFVKNEIAGIRIPDEIVARYDANMSKEEAEWVGVELAKELMQEMANFADGYYFMLPFNRVSMIEKLL